MLNVADFHFTGLMKGAQERTSIREGTKESGLEAAISSSQGTLSIQVGHANGVDLIRLLLNSWDNREKVLYEGTLSGLTPEETQKTTFKVAHPESSLVDRAKEAVVKRAA